MIIFIIIHFSQIALFKKVIDTLHENKNHKHNYIEKWIKDNYMYPDIAQHRTFNDKGPQSHIKSTSEKVRFEMKFLTE